MARLRYNGLKTTLGASLTSSATAVTFAAALTHSGGTAVPTIVAGNYIPLSILDTNGVTEIVYLTAYTAGATTGTITRGREGTPAVAHASGDRVVHAILALDLPSDVPLSVKVGPVAAVASSGSNPEYTYDETVNGWTTTTATTGTLRYQLARPLVATGYSISRVDGSVVDRNPTAWTFQGSNDAATWTTLDTRSGITWPTNGEVKTFDVANSVQYLYYRLNITANNGSSDSLSVREFVVFSSVPQVVNPVPVASAVASGGANPEYAYDKTANAWSTAWGIVQAPGLLRYQLMKPLVVVGYAITGVSGGVVDRNPSAWKFQGSADGATWVTLDTQTGVTWSSAGETKSYTAANATRYLYYRLNITANAGSSDTLSLQEWALTAVVSDALVDDMNATDPRTLYRDDCAYSAVPAGASISGGTTYEVAEVRRKLVGSSTYVSAPFALRGTVVAAVDLEHLTVTNGADLEVKLMKGASIVCRFAFQADGNAVAYDSAGTARGNTGSGSFNTAGLGASVSLSVSAATGHCSITVSPLAGGAYGEVAKLNSGSMFGLQTSGWTSGLAGLASGDTLTLQIAQAAGTGARSTAVYRAVVANGSRPR